MCGCAPDLAPVGRRGRRSRKSGASGSVSLRCFRRFGVCVVAFRIGPIPVSQVAWNGQVFS
jgi:hypothetical protein